MLGLRAEDSEFRSESMEFEGQGGIQVERYSPETQRGGGI